MVIGAGFCAGRTVGLGLLWGNGCRGTCGQRAPGDLGGLEGELGARSWRVQDTGNEEKRFVTYEEGALLATGRID